jgi:hypothetical protein
MAMTEDPAKKAARAVNEDVRSQIEMAAQFTERLTQAQRLVIHSLIPFPSLNRSSSRRELLEEAKETIEGSVLLYLDGMLKALPEPCERCNGKGFDDEFQRPRCTACGGTGEKPDGT